MKIQIKNRFDDTVIFETDAESLGAAVVAAIAARINLRYANLRSADLRSADLSYADLSYANLRSADLRYADLRYANLRYANLRSADLRSADLRYADLRYANLAKKELVALIAFRTILPDGDLIGWKKLIGGTICKLKIPSDAKRIGGLIGRKCRAEYALVLEGDGTSERGGIYKVGETVLPDSYDPDPVVECSNGIHFYITRAEAEAHS